jgi:hypothetical protein
MTDLGMSGSASYTVLHEGYGSPNVASTVGYIEDGDVRVVIDPGMVRDRSLILDPLRAPPPKATGTPSTFRRCTSDASGYST